MARQRIFHLAIMFFVTACDAGGCESLPPERMSPGTGDVGAGDGGSACVVTGSYAVTTVSGPSECGAFSGACAVTESGGTATFTCFGSEGDNPTCALDSSGCSCSFTTPAGDFGTADLDVDFRARTVEARVAGAVCEYSFERQ